MAQNLPDGHPLSPWAALSAVGFSGCSQSSSSHKASPKLHTCTCILETTGPQGPSCLSTLSPPPNPACFLFPPSCVCAHFAATWRNVPGAGKVGSTRPWASPSPDPACLLLWKSARARGGLQGPSLFYFDERCQILSENLLWIKRPNIPSTKLGSGGSTSNESWGFCLPRRSHLNF